MSSFYKTTFLCGCMILLGMGCSGCGDGHAALELLDEQNPDFKISENSYGMHLRVLSQEGLDALRNNKDSLREPCGLTLVNARFSQKDSESLCRFSLSRLKVSDCTFDASALKPFAQLPTLKRVLIQRSLYAKDQDTYSNITTLTDELADEFRVTENLADFALHSCDQFTGRCFSKWEVHPSMRKITLARTGVDDEGIKAIVKTFPNLEGIRIDTVDGERVTLDGCLELAKLRGVDIPGLTGAAIPDRNAWREYLSTYREEYRKIHGK